MTRRRSGAVGAAGGGSSRRRFLQRAGAVALAAAGVPAFLTGRGRAQGDVVVGAVHDLTGPQNIYGIQQSKAARLAIDHINAAGGVLGRTVRYLEYDSQSRLEAFVQHTTTLLLRDRVTMVTGALTSAAREAMRPVVARYRGLYFYNPMSEGGVCDRNTFMTGSTTSQQLSVLIPWVMENLGDTFYVVAPDYNFGTITATWVEKYVGELGGRVLGKDFIPLSESNFGPTIAKLQSLQPRVVVALPVGDAQTGFYAQFAAAGLKDRMAIVSTNYGTGNQQLIVPPDAGEGIVAVATYFTEIDSPGNRAFVQEWAQRYGEEPITSDAANTYVGLRLWALGVNKAGSLDRQAVLEALEDGVEFEAPWSRVRLHGPSHHAIHTMYLARGNRNHGFDIIGTFPDVEPVYEMTVCDFEADPNLNRHFIPEI